MSELLTVDRFGLAIDIVALTIEDATLKVLLVRRRTDPFANTWALPGTLVRQTETLDETLLRSFGPHLSHEPNHLEQLYTHTSPKRDPRGSLISVSYLLISTDPKRDIRLVPSEFDEPSLFPVATILEHRDPPLAFDHQEIVTTGVERARSKIEYTTLATSFLPPSFTIEQLRGAYEAIWGFSLNPLRFRQRVMSIEGFIVPFRTLRERPSRFVKGPASLLHPALLRESPRLDPDESLRRHT